MKNTGALEGLLAGSAGTYLLETAPVLALQLDTESRLVEANAYARRVLGEQAIGCPVADCLAGFPGPLELAALAAGGHHVHRLSLRRPGRNARLPLFPAAGRHAGSGQHPKPQNPMILN